MTAPTLPDVDPLPPVPVPSTPTPTACQLPGLRANSQCQTFWCWAAVLQELRRLYGEDALSQCALAAQVFTTKNCECFNDPEECDRQTNSPCNDTYDLPTALDTTSGYKSKLYPHQVQAVDICNHLRNRRPVVARFVRNNQGHYVLIASIRAQDDHWFLEVSDPDTGSLINDIRWVDDQDVTYRSWSLEYVYLLEEEIQ